MAGKERSRRNSLRHGLTGAGIVLPTEDVAAIEERFAEFAADLRPAGGVARFLVQRAALLSVRLDRSALHEAANLTARILDLPADDPGDVEAAMEELFDLALARPVAGREELLAQPGGIDRLIAALLGLRAKLGAGEAVEWSSGHGRILEALLGHDPAALPARSRLLSDVVLGDFSQLRSAETADLDPAGKQRWAADRLAHLIDAEVNRLGEYQATLPPPAPAPAIHPMAANLALFDASAEAVLARRYEASTERALFRTLKEVRAINAQQALTEQVPALDLVAVPAESGSFCPRPGPARPGPSLPPEAPVFADFGLDRSRPLAPRSPERVVIGRPPTG